MKTIVLIVFMAISLIIGYCVRPLIKFDRIYRLEKPLRIVTNNPDDVYLLPIGTALYLDGPPQKEGFQRYRIYINVNGGAFPVKKAEKYNLIIPLNTFNDGYDN